MFKNQTDWFTTGNPFVDMGQEMMAALADVDEVKDLNIDNVKPLLLRLVDIYMQADWRKSLQTVFPNSKLINPSIKNHREAYSTLLKDWFKLLSSNERSLSVPCAISGKSAQVYLSKVYLPMSDFGGGNFQSANEEGVPVSASVALALQFFPLGLVKIGKMLALPQFSNDNAQYKWAEDCYKYVEENETTELGGVRDTGTFRAVNAFFTLIERLLRKNQDIVSSSVTLYLFNNFNQVNYKAASEIYYMPARVFNFIRLAMTQTLQGAWQTVVRRGYIYKKDNVDDNELQKYSNLVYSNLLAGKSISGFFTDRKKHCPIVRGEVGWKLYKSYLMEVQGMNQQRLESLRSLGDRLAPLIQSKKKRLLRLERANSRGELTGILYRLTKDSAAAGKGTPLITFDQLVSDVFPHDMQYSDWREVKYLLLFRVYEQLFDELKDDPEMNTDDDIEEEQDG